MNFGKHCWGIWPGYLASWSTCRLRLEWSCTATCLQCAPLIISVEQEAFLKYNLLINHLAMSHWSMRLCKNDGLQINRFVLYLHICLCFWISLPCRTQEASTSLRSTHMEAQLSVTTVARSCTASSTRGWSVTVSVRWPREILQEKPEELQSANYNMNP